VNPEERLNFGRMLHHAVAPQVPKNWNLMLILEDEQRSWSLIHSQADLKSAIDLLERMLPLLRNKLATGRIA